jgi:hypothetical protein
MGFQVTNIHRRSNGTVDTDVYRQKAFVLRRKTTNQIVRRLGRIVGPLIGAIAIPVSCVLRLPCHPVRQGVSKFARAKVSPGSLKTPKLNHRSQ